LSEEDPRAEIWKEVFSKLEFPLKNPISHNGKAVGEPRASFLMGDWDALSQDEQNRMIQAMKKKFGVDEQVFRAQIRVFGYVPIKDENITVIWCKKHTRAIS
jgi:hypothetical protein